MHSTELLKSRLIHQSTSKGTGIYYIYCIHSHKIYVGSSKNISRRWNDHKSRLRHNKHPNNYLQATYNKYKQESLHFGVLENCSKEALTERENYFIALLDPEIRMNLMSTIRGGEISSETLERMSKASKGRKSSVESYERMRRAQKALRTSPTFKQPNYILSFQDVVLIKKLLLRNKLPQNKIAELFKVGQGNIKSIRNNRSWKHVPTPTDLEISKEWEEIEKEFEGQVFKVRIKLQIDQVLEIKRLLSCQKPTTDTEIAKRYNVHKSTIGKIKKNKNWAHVL